jgi:isoquinoline 1-oxidoreductase beta subunit
LTRRELLRLGVASGAALVLGLRLDDEAPAASTGPHAAAAKWAPNAYLRVAHDGTVTVLVPRAEMGQGVLTALPMLVAEELDVPWEQVRVEPAPAARVYRDSWGLQATSGSTSVRDGWKAMRQAGAAARAMLVTAAARQWRVLEAECRTHAGEVIHAPSGMRLAYADLVANAARVKAPEAVQLKNPDRFAIVGTAVARVDTPAKTRGTAEFGLDVQRPGMLVARVLMAPTLGGQPERVAAKAALQVAGVRQVVAIDGAIAVVADGYWAATKGLEALKATWRPGPLANLDSAAIGKKLRNAAAKKGLIVRQEGDAGEMDRLFRLARSGAKAPGSAGMAGGSTLVAWDATLPYLAHATMEPMTCTASVTDGWVDLWVPTQAQSECQKAASRVAGVPEDRVRVHTTFLGGGFGRRLETDFVAQAVAIARRTGRPVKLIWSREDDIRHDVYRPATLHRLKAVLDRTGKPIAWSHQLVGPSLYARKSPEWLIDGVDETAIEGAATLPYAIPSVQVRHVVADPGVPIGYWRSVGHSYNAFAVEHFMDVLARRARQDPLEFRLRLLAGASDSSRRLSGVLRLAADQAGWGRTPAPGIYRGLAVHASYGSYCAQVAEVAVAGAEIRVRRVVCALDCGRVVNPRIVESQVQGAVAFGLTAALHGEITFTRGMAVQSNFHDYRVLRMSEMPAVEVHRVTSAAEPGGVGEPGVPPVAPALANAVFSATGVPVRRLPIRA